MVSDEFENPLDAMPIATNDNKYAPPEKMIELEENFFINNKGFKGLKTFLKEEKKLLFLILFC